eukprot:6126332-Prymnesium_polylepis.1
MRQTDAGCRQGGETGGQGSEQRADHAAQLEPAPPCAAARLLLGAPRVAGGRVRVAAVCDGRPHCQPLSAARQPGAL